ncbi:Shikimate 5-dehydrogenase [Cryobacterium psychrotolerans]|uniref:Shikimate 5-dehydrogenase n=1 Tax=Cryobacterium psychrotolerans TaxID=386301 RepID=A0A1G9ETB2_9MICO|nr:MULTISPECIES: shikimate dehydrogenase [Cryobacterium]TFD41967.1 shikimate dehydrogenase [Cryobacterium sp. TMT1-2-1]TFD83625.1 shikimate dehydrogenase [Cryobacterium psychrotolerans]SDK79396.1 Shikimate 5-dehydrogenase [Cryobacterium psychrotolerans]
MSGYMGFVGVSTAQSSIMNVFPIWAEILGLPTRTLIGHDLPVDATPQEYRRLVEAIRDDPDHRGALVTTHKMGLYAAASDLFDSLDEFSTLCGEISSISKHDGRLIGHAKDPITAGLALGEFLPADHFGRTRAHAVCLGAGGAGTALTWNLAERDDAPELIVVTDTSRERLDHLRGVHERRGTPGGLIRYVLAANPADTRDVFAAAPQGSLIVNASGLGKDRPGSPVPDGTRFPEQSYVWEFNYRGTLEFLGQARAQETASDLVVVDGWRYFIHGWSRVIAEVFGVRLTEELVARLSEAALASR